MQQKALLIGVFLIAFFTLTAYAYDSSTAKEFNKRLQVMKMESNSGLSESVFSQRVLRYLSKNYPNSKITQWKNEGRKQQLELDNKFGLDFDRKGFF